MKSKECPRCRALLVQASTVCGQCGHKFEGVHQPPVPAPTWLPPEDIPPPPQSGEVPAGGPMSPSGGPPAPGGDQRAVDAPPFTEPVQGIVPPPGPPGYGAPNYGAPGYGGGIQEAHPRATTAMVLGILALVLCGFLGIPAVIIANNVLRDMRAQPGRYSGESSARAGLIMGWIAIGLMVVSVIAIVAIVMLGSSAETRFSQIGPTPVTEF